MRKKLHDNHYRILAVLLVIFNILAAWGYAAEHAVEISIFHLDGAYQTASTLFRLAAGQLPGRDFMPYLGIGPFYLLYPAFLLAGKNMAASQFAAYFMTALAYLLSVFLIAFFLIKSRQVIWIALLVATCTWILHYFHVPGTYNIQYYIIPGNSLRPIRAFIAYLLVLCIYIVLKKPYSTQTKIMLLGAISGSCLLWSSDYAIPSFIMGLCFISAFLKKNQLLSKKNIAYLLGVSIITPILAWYCVTAGHIQDVVTYNYIDVPHDQYWYFGQWHYKARIFSLADVIIKLLPFYSGWPLTLLYVAALCYWQPRLEHSLLLLLGCILFAGGLIASVGGHIGGYEFPYIFWAKTTTWLLTITLLLEYCLRTLPAYTKDSRLHIVISSACCIILVPFIYHYPNKYREARLDISSSMGYFYSQELGGYLPLEWQDYINLAKASASSSVIEEYWGLWSAFNNQVSMLPVDSTIHALGSMRQKFSEKLDTKPDYIITTKRSTSIWQTWNISANYWFYQKLFEDYRPTFNSPYTTIWKKQNGETFSQASCQFDEDDRFIAIDNAQPWQYYEVRLSLDYQAPRRSLLMLKNNIGYAAAAKGYVSLDPAAKEHMVMVHTERTGKNIFPFQIILPFETATDASLSITSCHARLLMPQYNDILAYTEETYRMHIPYTLRPFKFAS